jgi:hypothetical protein
MRLLLDNQLNDRASISIALLKIGSASVCLPWFASDDKGGTRGNQNRAPQLHDFASPPSLSRWRSRITVDVLCIARRGVTTRAVSTVASSIRGPHAMCWRRGAAVCSPSPDTSPPPSGLPRAHLMRAVEAVDSRVRSSFQLTSAKAREQGTRLLDFSATK